MSLAQGRRLDSWKSIAEYLGRNVRTVTRWADERGLPVRRVPGGKRQAVFAYTGEIDAWLNSRDGQEHGASVAEEAGEEKEELGAAEVVEVAPAEAGVRHEAVRVPKRNWRLLLAGAACLVAVGWIVSLLVNRNRTAASARTGELVQLTDDGHFKMNLQTDGKELYFTEAQGARHVLLAVPVGGGQVRQIATPFSNVGLLDVSHHGQSLLVNVVDGTERDWPLWIVPAQGGAPRRVGSLLCHAARWSPDDREIACASGNKILLTEAEGGKERSLGSFPLMAGSLAWSPDGRRIRFNLDGGIPFKNTAWEMRLDQDRNAPAALSKLSFGENCCTNWGWFDGNNSFVYGKPKEGHDLSVFVRPETDGIRAWFAAPKEVRVKIGKMHEFATSGSDQHIYFVITNAFRGELLKFDPKQQTFQTFLPGVSAHFVSFSRDGQWITYTDSTDESLWRSRANGSEAVRLTPPGMEVELSAWSPDGKQVAFMAREAGKPWRVFLVSRDGGVVREAAAGEDNQGAPTWSPDGKSLVYASAGCQQEQPCGVYRIDLTTKKVEMVPGSSGFRTARWSPDGKHIAALEPKKQMLMLYDVATHGWRALADSVSGDDVNWSKDSQYIYVNSPLAVDPIIERVRASDGQREVVADLSSLRKMSGEMDMWFGLAPDESPILLHLLNPSEVYSLDWTNR